MKEMVIKLLKKALKSKKIKMTEQEIEKILEIPPSSELGDYSFPCFFLTEKLKMEPHQIALELRGEIGTPPATEFDDVQTKGPYINFYLGRKNMGRKVVWEAITFKEKYGKTNYGEKKKVIVEFSSPNIAKPFGIGHLRSTIIGNSIANILEFEGYKVVRMNYLGDWGTQFGKLLAAYDSIGDEKRLHKERMQYLLELYIKANKSKKYEEKGREWFKKMEEGDRKSIILWKIFKEFSLKEFHDTYKKLGIKFDVWDGESNYNRKMQNIIDDLKRKKLLKKSRGAFLVDLKQYGLDVALIQKSDGGTLYHTRDLASAVDRYKKHKFDQMIYEVGQEQKLYFKQLFKILELMGYEWAQNCVHVDHGLYLGKDGKRFATRKGGNVFMEDVLEEAVNLARKQIEKKSPKIKKSEMEERALKMAIAAIFYGDLKNNKKNNIVFDIKKFVSFEGDTGPYLQYSYARATSILKKAPKKSGKFEVPELTKNEVELVKKILQFQDTVLDACKTLSPSIVANYAYQLAQLFNEFYHACPVIGSEEEPFRLALTEAFRQVLKNSLKLLGIPVLEQM